MSVKLFVSLSYFSCWLKSNPKSFKFNAHKKWFDFWNKKYKVQKFLEKASVDFIYVVRVLPDAKFKNV